MPLAWPRAYVHTWRLSDVILVLLTTGYVAGDHHHHHRSPRYGAPGIVGSPIALLNPWLSACDLAQPHASPDLQGPCALAMPGGRPAPGRPHVTHGDIPEGPGPPRPPGRASDEVCPRSCTVHNTTQCLHYFRESDAERLCGGTSLSRLAELRLRHCCEHSVAHSLPPEALKAVLSSSSQCSHYLGALYELDVLAARISCEFNEILFRYDCDHQYSVAYQCTHCQEAYRRWVCGNLLPHFARPGGPRVRPCRSVCRSVEQKCPFFLPGDRAPAYPTQYAGEPTFLCLDPNIPESGPQLRRSSYGEEDCCYRHCSERGLPWLCPSQQSCLEGPPEAVPPPVFCEPPPPAPTPAPGERTLPSACAVTIPLVPPRPSSGAGLQADSCLLALIGLLILHQLFTKIRTSSPARRPVVLVGAGRCVGGQPGRPSNRPRPNPWPRPSSRARHRARLRPTRPLTPSPAGPLLFLLLRRRVILRTNRLGKRTTTSMISSLFFVEHVT